MVAVKLLAVCVVDVFAILVTFDEKLDTVDDCHLTILPVCPLKVKLVLFVPVHTVALPAIVPPTLAGLTVTVALALLAESQTPLLIIAL